MSYENYENDFGLPADTDSDFMDDISEDIFDYEGVREAYEEVAARDENPADQLFGKEGCDLPEGVCATDYQDDGNGLRSRLIDLDGDDIYETIEATHTSDGVTDGVIYLIDVDGDGFIDREDEYAIASDGTVSERMVRVDVDGDGIADVVQVQEKTGDAQSFAESEFTPAASYIYDEDLAAWRETVTDASTPEEQEQKEYDKKLVDTAVHPFTAALNDFGDDLEPDDDKPAPKAEPTDEPDDEPDDEPTDEPADEPTDTTSDTGVTEQLYDTTGDGLADYGIYRATVDNDGDGKTENYYWETRDLNGDGNIDTVLVASDFNGDGRYDLVEGFEYNRYTGEMESVGTRDISDENRGDFYFELPPFDPEKATDVKGDPAKAMELWEYQGDTQRCAVYAQMFVIEEMTGVKLDINDLAEFATDRGWFDEASGTAPADMNKLLDAYGIPNELKTGCDMNEIEDALENGKRVIVAVDADEYASGENDDVYVPGDGANHAVEVIGIDRSDPERPMVILNDSGHIDGKGAMIPMDEFVDAWDDSNNLAVICG